MYADATVVLVDITCVYEKQINSTIGVGFGILPTIRYPSPYLYHSSYIRYSYSIGNVILIYTEYFIHRTISERKVTGAFDINMYLYRDDSFLPAHRYQTSPQIAQGGVLLLVILCIQYNHANT